MKTICTLVLALFTAGAFADEPVRVASLQVKERLQSIEQINVTAEKEQLNIKPESDAVAALLDELDELEKDSETVEE